MKIIIVFSMIIGGLLGYFIIPCEYIHFFNYVIPVGLSALMFLCGVDIGKQKGIVTNIKKSGFRILVLPLLCVIGTLIGGGLSSIFLNLTPVESTVCSAGLGWYTLAPFYVEPYNVELSAITFLTNVLREFLALIIIPVVAKRIGYLETTVVAAAPSMDVCLPVIDNCTDAETTIYSFLVGLTLTLFIPIIMSFSVTLL